MGRGLDREAAFEPRTFTHRTDRGELRIVHAAPTVVHFAYDGFSDGSFPKFIQDVWDREGFGALDRVQVYVDTSGQTGTTSEFRTGLLRWARPVLAQADEYVLLVKSRWIAMGIALVRAAVRLLASHIEVQTKPDVFQAQLEAAVRRSLADPERARGASAAAGRTPQVG